LPCSFFPSDSWLKIYLAFFLSFHARYIPAHFIYLELLRPDNIYFAKTINYKPRRKQIHILVHDVRKTEMEEWPLGNFVDTGSTPLFTASKHGNIRFMHKNPNNEIFRKWWHWIWFATSSGFITSQHPAMACLVQQASLNGCCFHDALFISRSWNITYWVSLHQN
jgi:hypothetical protein